MWLRFLVTGGTVAAVVGVSWVGSARAQVAIPEGYEVGTHIVRQGDTLREVTTAYLGSDDLWETNWQLNPDVRNPDLLFPLQRLQVLVEPRVSRPVARLTTISGKVEGKPVPSDWYLSEENDLMIERDGVRAGKDESAVMKFLDGSEITVKDDSTVFLRVAGRSLRGFEQRSVEVVRGAADLAAASLPRDTEIEVVIGSAVAMPKTAESGRLETRARRVEAGGAHVMVFEGAGEVVAAGETVVLGKGTGTAIPEQGPPAPPEKLLVAVTGLRPGAGAEAEAGRSMLSWSPVDGAASYTVELCRDAGCGNLVTRRTGFTETSWHTAELPVGDFFWRVTAVSASGLDGFASEARAVRIVPFRDDSRAPTGELVVTGTSVEVDGALYFAGDLAVRLEVDDDVTGVESVTFALDGREVGAEDLLGPWPSGDYSIEATAVDGAGNSASFGPLEVRVDADPPRVEVSVVGAEMAPGGDGETWQRQSGRWSRRELHGVEGLGWAPRVKVLDWSEVGRESASAFLPNLIRTESAADSVALAQRQVGLLVFAPALVLVPDFEPLGDRVMMLEADDGRSGLARFDLRRRPGPDGWYWLEVEAVDEVGNVASLRWQFARSR